MDKVPVREAIGLTLCHDITRIVPGTSKTRAFKRGHIITADDIDLLLDLGKEHIYIWREDEGLIHEDDAAVRLVHAAVGNDCFEFNEPNQGRISIKAARAGLLNINRRALNKINAIEGMVFATLKSNTSVHEGQTVAGVRVIPLAIDKGLVEQAEAICKQETIFADIRPFRYLVAGIVTTGNEICNGRIEDGFRPVLEAKFKPYKAKILATEAVPDQPEKIAAAIHYCIGHGAQLVCVTGGMSVDPDDTTPAGIGLSGAEVAFYGVPALPGSMLMLAYLGDVAVVGLPGCILFNKITTFDLLLPYLFAGDRMNREWAVNLGEGGLCQNCEECHFPNCSFNQSICIEGPGDNDE